MGAAAYLMFWTCHVRLGLVPVTVLLVYNGCQGSILRALAPHWLCRYTLATLLWLQDGGSLEISPMMHGRQMTAPWVMGCLRVSIHIADITAKG